MERKLDGKNIGESCKNLNYEKHCVERLDNWYRGFDKIETKLALMDLVPGIDTGKLFKHMDNQIIKKIPNKLK